MTARPGTHAPAHHPTALAVLGAMLEASCSSPSHRQLTIVGDALADHLAEVGLVLVPAPAPAPRGRVERHAARPIEAQR